MKYFLRKIYLSMIMSLLIIITVATSTYAWYSSNQNALISDFTIGISNSDDANMAGLELSIDGINFKESLDEIDVARAVLKQKGYDVNNLTDASIKNLFSKLTLSNATPKNATSLTNGFKMINADQSFSDTEEFLSLDLYVSIYNDKYVGLNEGVEVYFQKGQIASGEDKTTDLLVSMPDHPLLGPIPTRIKMNPINAARIGVVTYGVMPKGKPTNTAEQTNNIYSFSSDTPSISSEGVYNFGGINQEYNAMLEYYNLIMASNYGKLNLPAEAKNRKDELVYGQQIISSEMGCRVDTMVKVRFYIWMEGWDSDCFNTILNAKSSYSIKLTTINA